MFAAVVPSQVVEQILSQIQYSELADKGVGKWQITILSDSMNATVSQKLIENLHPSIVVEQAVGSNFPESPDQWKHIIKFYFKEHPNL